MEFKYNEIRYVDGYAFIFLDIKQKLKEQNKIVMKNEAVKVYRKIKSTDPNTNYEWWA